MVTNGCVQKVSLESEHSWNRRVVDFVVDGALHQIRTVVVLDEALPQLFPKGEFFGKPLLAKVLSGKVVGVCQEEP